MKKHLIAGLVAAAGLAKAGSAEVNTRVDFLLSVDGGPFQPSVSVIAGTGSHTVEAVARFTYIGSGQALGFASAAFQPTVSNWGPSDTAMALTANVGNNTSGGAVADVPGQYGRISPFARTALTTSSRLNFFTHTNGAGGAPFGSWLRIAQLPATSWIGGPGNTTGGRGVPVAQLANIGRTASDPAFNSSLSVNVFRWGMAINSNDFFSRQEMVVDAALPGFGNFNTATGEREVYWWGDLNASTGDLRGTAVVNPGYIYLWLPSPAGVAALAGAALGAGRRRR